MSSKRSAGLRDPGGSPAEAVAETEIAGRETPGTRGPESWPRHGADRLRVRQARLPDGRTVFLSPVPVDREIFRETLVSALGVAYAQVHPCDMRRARVRDLGEAVEILDVAALEAGAEVADDGAFDCLVWETPAPESPLADDPEDELEPSAPRLDGTDWRKLPW